MCGWQTTVNVASLRYDIQTTNQSPRILVQPDFPLGARDGRTGMYGFIIQL